MVTIKEVAELAKVSQATVSRVLNNNSTVKELNKDKVYQAIAALGYQPNSIAQALASNRSNSIGVLVGSLEGWFFGSMMQKIEGITRNSGYHLIATCGHVHETQEIESLKFLDSRRVDGVIVHADKMTDEEIIALSKNERPLVIVNRHIPELSDNCFYFDNELGGYIAGKHLIDCGHKNIGIITGFRDITDCIDRLSGYHRALQEADIEIDHSLVYEGTFYPEGNSVAVKRLFDEHPTITAVLCQNDNIAMAVYDECRRRNLIVGEDISVIGFDNSTYCSYIRPTLTTIKYPIEEIAINATHKLLNLIYNTNLPVQTSFTPELIARESVCRL
jgi:LacI family transcriptional regulator